MIQIDPKYFSNREFSFNMADKSKNPIDYHNFYPLWIGNMQLYSGIKYIYNERLGIYEQGKYTISLFNAQGVELATLDKASFEAYKRHLLDLSQTIPRKELDVRFADGEDERRKARLVLADVKRTYYSEALAPIIKYVAKEPECVGHIPSDFFFEHPTLAEEILTEYQNVKMGELKALPAQEDCSPFVESIKQEVEAMNKIFNNIEKSKDVEKNFGDLFKRDKEV